MKQIKTNTLPFVRGLAPVLFVSNNLLCFTLGAAAQTSVTPVSCQSDKIDGYQTALRDVRMRDFHWSVAAEEGL